MILVIDSGIWVSALHFGGTPMIALESACKRFGVAICEPIIEEIYSVLQRKFDWETAEIDSALAEYFVEVVQVGTTGSLRGICRDPKDDMVLECAILGGAEIIVTGDKDLLTLGLFRGIRILTPRQFLTLQRAEGSREPS